jgi:hypothetical protein
MKSPHNGDGDGVDARPAIYTPLTQAIQPNFSRPRSAGLERGEITVTLNPTCPLCGLRFASRPLLDLHVREDHRDENHRVPDPTPEPGPD